MSTQPPEGWLVPARPQLLEPGDRFTGLDVAASDFWRWAFSDLRDNTTRGILAEFLVAATVGRTAQRRKGWDNFDVQTESGIRVEVKASGYLQSWPQARHSQVNFGRVAARTWDENTNTLGEEPEVRADVFVFAVQTSEDHALYDALDVGQWEFYVVSAGPVRDCGSKSVTIGWVRRHAEPVSLGALAEAIEAAGAESSTQPPTAEAASTILPTPATTLTYVFGNQVQPRMRHRTDCPHQVPTVTTFRSATTEQMRTLPACPDCARRD